MSKTRTPKHYEARARIAKALAHPSRLLILDLIQRREMCVNDLTEVVGADQTTVSKHLALLHEVGLVGRRRKGSLVLYKVTCGCLDGFFECLESVLLSKLNECRIALK